MSPSHGTGAIFLRNFSTYPPDRLCNAFISTAEGACLPHSIDLNAARWPHSLGEQLAALPARFSNRLHPSRWHALPASRTAIAQALAAVPFPPDLIYAVCWGAEGLVTLDAVLQEFTTQPLLVHFHDFWPSAAVNFIPLLKRIAPRITVAWAISPPLADFVTKITGLPCHVESPFHIALPAVHKDRHHTFGKDFPAVLIGNFWNDALLVDVKAVWRRCQQQLPQLAPIEWYGPADAPAKLRAVGLEPEPEMRPMGFLRGEALWQMLASADLALIPFSRDVEPATDYERYSIPSRITELAAAGLPLFGLTGPRTPLARYLEDKRIGRFAPACDTTRASEMLCDLIVDKNARETLGRAARAVAAAEYPIAEYQNFLYARLAAIAEGVAA